jgi:hypothetical protein
MMAERDRQVAIMVPEREEPVGWVHVPGGIPSGEAAEVLADMGERLHASLRHGCCGGMADRGHTTRCPGQLAAKVTRPARPRRSLAQLAGSVGDSAAAGIVLTWVVWLTLPGIGWVHAAHLCTLILAAAAAILTVAAACGYGHTEWLGED